MSRVTHFEIPADDPEKTMKFYTDVFGWKFEKWEGPVSMDYWLAMTGDPKTPGIDGAVMPRSQSDRVINTLDVESIDEIIPKIEASGGKIVVPKMAVPTIGWMIYFTDPSGNQFGAMQSDPDAK